MNRRELLTALPVVASGIAPAISRAEAVPAGKTQAPGGFPSDFLWGAATSGHQVEGNNLNSDVWLAEHAKPTLYSEPSGDACDHYHRYRDDIALMSQLGLNCYRFSLEWSRIEPERGEFSRAELDHYRRVLGACHDHGIKPFVTFNHVSTPRWFAALGGWENADSPSLFARYCERAGRHLGDLIGVAATLNEPPLAGMMKWGGLPPQVIARQQAMFDAAAAACGSKQFSMLMSPDTARTVPNLLNGHRLGAQALKSGPNRFPVGLTLNIADDQAVAPDGQAQVARKRAEIYEPYLAAAREHDDFIGVQNYGRVRYDRNGHVRPDKSAPDSDSFYPEGLETAIRYAARVTGKPVYISENGFNTADDTRRVEFIRRAVAGVKRALDDHVDVRSYVHWSLMDNFEWTAGYQPKYGLLSVDRTTLQRTIKPSAVYLGSLARGVAV